MVELRLAIHKLIEMEKKFATGKPRQSREENESRLKKEIISYLLT